MTHPGDSWDKIAIRSLHLPLLWIDGRRSFAAGWPPGAVCEECQTAPDPGHAGYCGPTPPGSDQIAYPRSDVRYTCISCARARFDLEPDELTGHVCNQNCRDGLCIDVTIQHRGVLGPLSPPERIAYLRDEYAAKGWRVVAAQRDPNGPVTMGGESWAIGIVPARRGVWPISAVS